MTEDQAERERSIDPVLARALKGEVSPEEEAAVRNWRRASPEHEAEYRELSRIVELSARLGELVAAPLPSPPSIPELIARSGREPLGRRRSWWTAAAAGAAAAAILVGALGYSPWREPRAAALRIQEIATAKMETAAVELLDGTVVRLGPSSRLRVVAGRGRREVTLEGRAFFAVAHDGTPFVIATEAGEVTVLGTRLDLEARGRDLRVVVVEGRVALSTQRARTQLTAGEMGRVRNGETAPVVRVPDIGAVVQWTGDFLAFQSTPLRDAAQEIERVYRVRVEISNAQLAQRVITAWFRDKSLDQVVDVVCLAVAARCSIEDGVVRILPDAHGGGR